MEYEQLFTENLHSDLKQKIKSFIHCQIMEDTLIVNIDNKEGINFIFVRANFAEKLRTGELTREGIVEEICAKFKTKVVNTFFYY